MSKSARDGDSYQGSDRATATMPQEPMAVNEGWPHSASILEIILVIPFAFILAWGGFKWVYIYLWMPSSFHRPDGTRWSVHNTHFLMSIGFMMILLLAIGTSFAITNLVFRLFARKKA